MYTSDGSSDHICTAVVAVVTKSLNSRDRTFKCYRILQNSINITFIAVKANDNKVVF